MNEVDQLTSQAAIHFAAGTGNNALVEALLSWGAAVNHQDHAGHTALYAACQEGHLICVQTLVKAGASLTLTSKEGYTSVHIAAQYNRVDIMESLLENGHCSDLVSFNCEICLSNTALLSLHKSVCPSKVCRLNFSARISSGRPV